MRESKGGQRKRAQVMVLSCWCHRQIRAALPPGCHLHLTQYPLYSLYHASLFRCARAASPGAADSLHLSLPPQQTAAASHSSVIPTLWCALPAQTVPSALLCLSVVSFFLLPDSDTPALFLACAPFAFHPRTLLWCFATAETFEPFQKYGPLPTQTPASKFSSRLVSIFFLFFCCFFLFM